MLALHDGFFKASEDNIMATTESRIRQLVKENLEINGQPLELPGDLNASLVDLGVSSLELVAFAKLVSAEFNITFTPEDCSNLNTIQQLIEHIDAQTD